MNGNSSASKKVRSQPKRLLQHLRDEDVAAELVSSSRGSIFTLKQRDSPTLQQKITEPLLLVHPITSLDDAIDLANAGDEPLLATYLFAAPAAAKYLSQFIDAHASFTNEIPGDLLVGPASPIGYPVSMQVRYTKEMFSKPRPEYINFTSVSTTIGDVLDSSEPELSQRLREEAEKPLPPTGQRAGKAIGFFEQGLLTGVTILATTTVTSVALVGIYMVPKLIRKLR